jgi:hypothetical protein
MAGEVGVLRPVASLHAEPSLGRRRWERAVRGGRCPWNYGVRAAMGRKPLHTDQREGVHGGSAGQPTSTGELNRGELQWR